MHESKNSRRPGGYRLDEIGLRELAVGFLRHPAVICYLSLLPVSAYLALTLGSEGGSRRLLALGSAALLTVVSYPLVWYLLHRFVLHGSFLYRSPRTAALWKRIHFDHHRDPHDLNVLFGAPQTTLPTMVVLLLPLGFLVGGAPGAAGAFTTALLVTLFYEYCHCIQHLAYTPKSRFLRRIKRLHLLHHYHNETGNFGITNFFWDRLLGTRYDGPGARARSESVQDLGYRGERRERYPWVARLTDAEEAAGKPG